MIYFDCFQGASADMLCGALFELYRGHDLSEKLNSFEKTRIKIYSEKVRLNAISGTRVSFKVEGVSAPPDLKGIKKFFEESFLEENIKKKVVDTYAELFKAEAAVHAMDPYDVKLHELSAPHKFAEITAYHIMSDSLNLFFSPPVLGSASMKSAHGTIPLPSPATAEILKGIPVEFSCEKKEMFTPSAAALLKVSADIGRPDMVVEKISYGIGKRSLLRIFKGERVLSSAGNVMEIEFNVDDMTPEDISFFTKKISRAGLDFYITPVVMKKSRPGHMISILAEEKEFQKIQNIIFNYTSTAGFRTKKLERFVVKRKIVDFKSSIGSCRIKEYFLPSGAEKIKPEYEDLKKISGEKEISLTRAREIISKEYKS
ncbi:MAG: LarC family nickel insertion protein [Elusimicrobiota bacterium]